MCYNSKKERGDDMYGLKIALLPCSVFAAWMMPVAAADILNIGWAEADVTPPLTKRVPLDGQYYQRLADTKDPHFKRQFTTQGTNAVNLCQDSLQLEEVLQPFFHGHLGRVFFFLCHYY